MPAPVSKAIQRNPFYVIIRDIVPKYGFKFSVDEGKSVHHLVLEGLHLGKPSTLRFPFPRICRTFTGEANFKSKLYKFVRDYTKEIGFISPDPRFQPQLERKSTYVQHIDHDPPKRQLVPPKQMMREQA